MNSKILHTPEGVRDIYGEEFIRKKTVCDQIMEQLHRYGYSDIQTPMFEYFDVFSNDIGTIPAKELYKFFDKEGDTLVLRPDFTPAIARCAAKYFMDEQIPLRFCYEGNTFVNTSELQGKLKETTQLGAEFIGDNSVYADTDILCLVIEGLLHAGLEEFQVSIGEISYFKGLCEEFHLSEEEEMTLRDYLSSKNYFGAEEYLGGRNIETDWISRLMPFLGDRNFTELTQGVHNEKSLNAIKRLAEIHEILKQRGYEKYVSFDLSILSKYHYYTGIIFRAYTYGVGDAIVKGGRYDGLLSQFGKNAPAIGCVFLADEIQTALRRLEGNTTISTNHVFMLYQKEATQRAFMKAKELRENGTNVEMLVKSPDIDIEIYKAYAESKEKMYVFIE